MATSADTTAEIEQFFADFEQASRDEEWERYGDLFLPQFMNMDPGAAGAIARDDLIAFLPHRRDLLRRAGATGTVLASLGVEPVDARHVLARTTWDVQFDREHDPVVLRTTFLLRHEDRWRVAVYLNHGFLPELLGLA